MKLSGTFLLLVFCSCGGGQEAGDMSRAGREVYDLWQTASTESNRAAELRNRMQELGEKYQANPSDDLRTELTGLQKEMQELEGTAFQKVDTLIDTATQELVTAPDDWAVLEGRGLGRLLKNDPKLALEDINKAIQLRPKRTRLIRARGEARYLLNRYEDALTDMESVLQGNANDITAKGFKGLCLFALHRFAEAEKLILEAHQSDTIPARHLLILGQVRKSVAEYVKEWDREKKLRAADEKADDRPRVRFTTSRGAIVFELFEDEAPNHVANFISLVESGLYDGTKFHRVIPNFMAQGGDPNTKDADPANDGQGGPGYKIEDEWIEGTSRFHFRGSISMANTGQPNTNGSQFFLTHQPTPWLNKKHCVFGRILEGQDVVDRMEVGDDLERAEVLRKRNHKYRPRKFDG